VNGQYLPAANDNNSIGGDRPLPGPMNWQMDFPGRVARGGVVVGAAILLTFCRGAMLAVTEHPTSVDDALNYFVVLIAPVCALYSLSQHVDLSFFKLIWPVGLLMVWVTLCLLFFTPQAYWPSRTPIISIILALLIASQISPAELKLLRYSILALSGLFSLVVLVWAPGLLSEAISGSAKVRLGADISAANVIFMPRVYYTLVFTCFATLVVERRLWLRLVAMTIMVGPALIGLASGSRGPLVALAVAVLAFSLGSMKRFGSIAIAVLTAIFALLSYKTVEILFPNIVRRVGEDDSLRVAFYEETLDALTQNLSLVGNGKGDDYAHNIFLEFTQDYGLIGLVLFLVVLGLSLKRLWQGYRRTRDVEVLWVIGIVLLQLVAQQFSMDIYVGSLWAALVLPIGLVWWQERITPQTWHGRLPQQFGPSLLRRHEMKILEPRSQNEVPSVRTRGATGED
jgi:hypothetical protein